MHHNGAKTASAHANPPQTVNFAASPQSTPGDETGNAFSIFLGRESSLYPGTVCGSSGGGGFIQQNVTAFAASPNAFPLGSPPRGPHVPGR